MGAENKMTLMQKIRASRAADPSFDRGHRIVQAVMGAWAAIVLLDRVIGVSMNAYEGIQLTSALAGGIALILLAWWGTRGHIQIAMMVMQINMAVVLIQFAATCFLYREQTRLWSTLFYGLSALIMVAGSLTLFLNRDAESYREKLRQLKGGGEKAPRYYRDGSRLIRNRKK